MLTDWSRGSKVVLICCLLALVAIVVLGYLALHDFSDTVVTLDPHSSPD